MSILVMAGDYETATHWGRWWFENLLAAAAKNLGYQVHELYAADATRAKVLEVCKIPGLNLVTGVGHGNQDVYTGQNSEVIFASEDADTYKAVKGKHLHLVSCIVRKRLGKLMVENGAVAFNGYDDTAYFFIDSKAFPNSIAERWYTAFLAPPLKLLEGGTEGNALRAGELEWEKQSEKMSPVEKIYAAHNLDCLGLEGDPNSRLEDQPPPPPGEECPWCGCVDPAAHNEPCHNPADKPCPKGFWACIQECFKKLFRGN